MKQNKNSKKPNFAYYAALGVGIVTLAILVGVYTRQSSNQNTDQYVDLDSQSDTYADGSLQEDAQNVNANVADAQNSDVAQNQDVADADSTNTDTIGKADLAQGAVTTSEQTTKATTQSNTIEESTETTNDTTEEISQNDTTAETQTEAAKETSSASFSKNKTLSWPVKGNVLLPFSIDATVYYQTIDVYKSSNGMVISSRKGTKVAAACDGTVTDIVKDDVYGNIVTVDIGEQYTLQYGQLADITVAVGDSVTKGQTIGAVAQPTDSFIVEGANLYFAMQKQGEYVNPEEFLQ